MLIVLNRQENWHRGFLKHGYAHLKFKETFEMARAIWNGAIIAESDDTVEVEGNQYFPADSIKQQYFESSDTTTVCGWKGTARYYHVVVDGNSNQDAAWFYPETKPEADNIRGYVAFWKGVVVEG